MVSRRGNSCRATCHICRLHEDTELASGSTGFHQDWASITGEAARVYIMVREYRLKRNQAEVREALMTGLAPHLKPREDIRAIGLSTVLMAM